MDSTRGQHWPLFQDIPEGPGYAPPFADTPVTLLLLEPAQVTLETAAFAVSLSRDLGQPLVPAGSSSGHWLQPQCLGSAAIERQPCPWGLWVTLVPSTSSDLGGAPAPNSGVQTPLFESGMTIKLMCFPAGFPVPPSTCGTASSTPRQSLPAAAAAHSTTLH